MLHILIVDDDENFSRQLASPMERAGFTVSFAVLPEEAFTLCREEAPDFVFLTRPVTDGSLRAVLQRFRSAAAAPEIIVLAENGNPEEAEIAINEGAWDYLPKNTPLRQLMDPLLQFAENLRHGGSRTPCAEAGTEEGAFRGLIGSSPKFRMCLESLSQAAASEVNVLLQGKTGTGKEKFAVAIHEASRRKKGNLVVVDCTALPATLIESALFGHERGAFTDATESQTGLIKQADGGTLFLDEIGELPLALQKSFLRVLEERRFRSVGGRQEVSSDFRLIAATNRDLEAMAEAGNFRRDLLFRLRTFSIQLPTLRERMGDLDELTAHFLGRMQPPGAGPPKKISRDFRAALERYDWPGNVRELRHALERALAVARDEPMLLARHLPTHIRVRNVQTGGSTPADYEDETAVADDQLSVAGGTNITGKTLQEVRNEAVAVTESRYLRYLLSKTGGNISLSCKVSGLSRSRLYQLLKNYGIRRNSAGNVFDGYAEMHSRAPSESTAGLMPAQPKGNNEEVST